MILTCISELRVKNCVKFCWRWLEYDSITQFYEINIIFEFRICHFDHFVVHPVEFVQMIDLICIWQNMGERY